MWYLFFFLRLPVNSMFINKLTYPLWILCTMKNIYKLQLPFKHCSVHSIECALQDWRAHGAGLWVNANWHNLLLGEILWLSQVSQTVQGKKRWWLFWSQLTEAEQPVEVYVYCKPQLSSLERKDEGHRCCWLCVNPNQKTSW